jgi:glycosyltransferase involved in cell wall biosynthesis
MGSNGSQLPAFFLRQRRAAIVSYGNGQSNMTPTHPAVGIIGLVPDAWSSRWFPRHHVMSRLSRRFPVVWINPRHGRHNLLAVAWRRLVRAGSTSAPPPLPDLDIYEPDLWLPEFYRPQWLGDWTLRVLLERAAKRLRRRGVRRVILYVWHPHFHRAPDVFHADKLFYHIDDEYSFADHEVPTEPEETKLIRGADQVIVHSKRLMAKKGNINPQTALIPNGADIAAFTTPAPEPADLAAIPHPRAGYTGALKKHLDWELLDRLTAAHPGVSFVFIGDREQHPEIDEPIRRLAARPNVHFLGVRPSNVIPAYVQHFDVCLMPYRRMAYTDYIYPMKLHEYLATGKPVIGTPIPSLQEFSSVVRLEATAEGWSQALADSLSPAALRHDLQASRRAVAADFDWDALVERIADLIVQRVGALQAVS